MNRIEEYVEKSLSDIPHSEKKEELKQEIIQNLREKVHDLIEQGKSQEDAENKAIVDFGDMEDIKRELRPTMLDTDGKYPYHRKPSKSDCWRQLWFSIWGSLLIITFFTFINLTSSPRFIWFVYPVFGILWWPLTMFSRWLKYK